MADWDRRGPAAVTKLQQAAWRQQLAELAEFSPYWRERLRRLPKRPEALADLATLTPVGERDLCPDGDAAGAAALVLQPGEGGFALAAEGPRLRKALARRFVRPGSYRALVDNATRPSHFTWSGLTVRYPVASTRGDLDVLTRAGARLWQVLGLSQSDVVVSAAGDPADTAVAALHWAALGAGSPLLAGPTLAAGLRLVPATVAVVPVGTAVEQLDAAGAALESVRTVLLLGSPGAAERAAVEERASEWAARSCAVLAIHAPAGHRVLWGECRQAGARGGLHTYPDIDLVQLADPETGRACPAGGELVLTQLGLRGSALLRWRTADVATSIDQQACPGCRRTVPRVVGARSAALAPELELRAGQRRVDLRSLGIALAARGDLTDWRVEVRAAGRTGKDALLVHVAPSAGADAAQVAVGVARDLRHVMGLLPTQVVVSEADRLPGEAGGSRLLVRG